MSEWPDGTLESVEGYDAEGMPIVAGHMVPTGTLFVIADEEGDLGFRVKGTGEWWHNEEESEFEYASPVQAPDEAGEYTLYTWHPKERPGGGA